MKKTLTFILSAVLLFSVLPFAAAETDAGEIYPTIMVAGYSASNLFLQTENGQEKVWGVDMNEILELVLENIAVIGRGFGELAFDSPKTLSDVVGEGACELYDVLAYNPDGTSVNDIRPYSQTAEATQYSYLYDALGGENAHEPEIMATVAELYGETGYDNLFAFQTDFRQNIIDIASDLDRYIDSVLEFTGKDKVNLFAVSHGGEICSVYFALYGDKAAVNNAVLTVPAIGGAALAYDVMSENVVFDEETLMYFIENGMMMETDINWLMKAQRLGVLDGLFNMMIRDHLKNIFGYWGSIWDFIPAEYYDGLKARFLDPDESADIIAKSDIYHYEIYPNLAQSFQKCAELGTNIYIVAGCDEVSVTGLNEQADGIIRVKDSTGALCALPGSRFADGYRGVEPACGYNTHDHVSPSMNIDSGTCFLPDETWFISGLFHGMTWKDPYTIALCCKLLFSTEHQTVYSDRSFPQFKYSENVCHTALAYFDNSIDGFVSGEDSVLYVKNLSEKYILRVKSVYCYGMDLKFDVPLFSFVKPGKVIEIPFTGTVPETSLTTADITVDYSLIGSVTPRNNRTQTFRIDNGDPAVSEDETVQARYSTDFDTAFSESFYTVLEYFGLTDYVKMIFNFYVNCFKTILSAC